MFTLQNTLKCVCHRRDVCNLLHRLLYRCTNRVNYVTYLCDVCLPSHIPCCKNVIMPKRHKSIKLDSPKSLNSTSYNKKPDSKKSHKDKESGKKKSVVSQFIIDRNPKKSVENDDSDISIVFDSTVAKRKLTLTSSDSEEDMGNVESEVLANNMECTSSSGRFYVASGQPGSHYCDQSPVFPNYQADDFSNSQDNDRPERRMLKSMRQWKYTEFGSRVAGASNATEHVMFTLLSYNLLAQQLIEKHEHLYRHHTPRALEWEYRSNLLLREIQEADAEIMCLQEVQGSHLEFFNYELGRLGYEGIFKQRTGDYIDGVAIYYKTEMFELIDHTSVEYFQPNIDVLNRHNVGLVAKLAVKRKQEVCEQQHIVVATTHLLFNPRRHDVKLAQMQILLTEVERYAFRQYVSGSAVYWPVIITGDMNFKPNTGVYRLVTEGSLQYEGLSTKFLEENVYNGGRRFDKELLPRSLDIVDTCQHWGIVRARGDQRLDHKTELRYLKIHNTDHQRIMKEMNMVVKTPRSFEDKVQNIKSEGLVNNFVPFFGPSEIPQMPHAMHGSGKLMHNLYLTSVYADENKEGVTTFHSGWVMVDFIFFSYKQHAQEQEGNLKLVSKYKLLNRYEADKMGFIPNMASPSDHYPLMAVFYLKL